MLVKHFVAALLALNFCTYSFAQDSRLSAAGAVVDAFLEIDGREQVRLAVDDMLRSTREYEYRAQYEEFFQAMARSPEFRDAKAGAFATSFSEAELVEMLELARNPIFRKYQERTPTLQRASSAAFAATLKPKIMEFVQKIESLKQSKVK